MGNGNVAASNGLAGEIRSDAICVQADVLLARKIRERYVTLTVYVGFVQARRKPSLSRDFETVR